uniref:putative disease resistance RPP13-like protein 1 n=1 Tax=Erigeron canadensis TaxID=72917 RepID=UPI001CB920B1|nr:putative disease resistance RPP13-like protein 1 [Erigeron canadensis]
MAELLVGAAVTVLIEKLLAGDFMKFARSQGIDSQLKKWKETLPMIQAVLADAAQKQITQKLVELWLVELQDLVYDIEDVLDDITTEAVTRNLQESSNGSTGISSKLLMMIPTPHNIMYGRKMSSNLDEITTRLAHLYEQRKGLGLKVINGETSTRTNTRLEETSLLPNVSEILGRDGDKEALLGKLLEDEGTSRISIVSIVGMGGIGKTTLARLLYNDQKVKDHFKLRAWVCVSNEFDVFSISKQIYQAVVGEDKTFTSLDLLHVALKEELSDKRFLLVLDDVWNEDHKKWEALKQLLVGARESKVIVTTRNTVVASVMDSVQPHNLGVLPYEIALSLFAEYALEEKNLEKHPSLSTIAQGIVKKCGGLPLALVTIGRVLKTKGNDVVEWEEVLNSEIWSSKDKSGILPALKLSYYHLPSYLKQLFAYCSLYPKDHQFDKNTLVLKWMAQGFLSQTRAGKSMEMLGHGYFEELRLRCFFQPSTDENSRYTMHDLMHDLAISVGGKFFFMLDDKADTNGRSEDFEKFRHFSFIGERYAEYRKLKELHRARCMRTFLAVGYWARLYTLGDLEKLLTRLQFLRVLSLTDYSITEVPRSIGNLKQLRYLSFSKTHIPEIPEEVGKLYNLQSLVVRDCDELSSLPKSLVNLKNLRHLDMAGTPLLEKTPLVIGGLTSLQALPMVCIEKGNGFKLSHLKGLSNLQGTLSIKELHNVIDPTEANEANEANLQQKKGLDDLRMEWSDFSYTFRDPVIEYVVLERLRPPPKLKKLSISFYGGVDFPSWLGNPTSFDGLSNLTLRGCENCKDLPTLGHLSSLESLEIDNMKCLETWMTGGSDNVETFQSFPSLRSVSIKDCWKLGKISFGLMPSLESLEVENLLCLERWSTIGGDDAEAPQSFPSLRKISIERCWKLGKVSFGLLPSLKDLALTRCPEAVLRDLVGVSSSIRKIELHGIVGLTHLDREVLKNLGTLEELWIWGCDELIYPWESELEACMFLRSLQKFYVHYCPKMQSINVGSGSLRVMTIGNCHSLKSYCCPNSVEKLDISSCDSVTSLSFSKIQEVDLPSSSQLKTLQIFNCKNIKSISQDHLQSLASLEEMDIRICPSLEDSFPSRGWLWPPNLRKLSIGELQKPLSEWGFQSYPPSLVQLSLHGRNSGVVSFRISFMEEAQDNNNIYDNNNTISSSCFLLPPSLTFLQIWDFADVESVSEVFQNLPHLQDFYKWGCPKLRDNLPETTSTS